MSRTLADCIGNIIVIAHKEDVTDLVAALQEFGRPIDVQRRAYSAEELALPAIARCLLNHADAWKKAEAWDGYTLIVEADFVPVQGLASRPIDWLPDDPMAWAHLYSSSPRLLAPFNGYYRIHHSTAVAVLINRPVACAMRDFVAQYSRDHGLASMVAWDTFLQWYAMGRGAKLYMPPRSLGEHGGMPNPEHARSGMRNGGMHRADRLAGPLAFKPFCARRNPWYYRVQRTRYRLAGIARVLVGRWILRIAEYPWSTKAYLSNSLRGLHRQL